MAAVHPGGAGRLWPAGELQQDPLESHEVLGGGERGEVHLQIHSAADRAPQVVSVKGIQIIHCQQEFCAVLIHEFFSSDVPVMLGEMFLHLIARHPQHLKALSLNSCDDNLNPIYIVL